MGGLLLSFGVIFAAEFGDKSQLMALTFATRYPALRILVGIAIATATVHGVSVLLGAALAVSIPTRVVTILAGISFLGFAAWTARGKPRTSEGRRAAATTSRSAIIGASVAFFLAELGDKTMLATIALATREGLVAVWVGSTLGMVAADAIAIAVGRQLGARLPERPIRLTAVAAFVVFGTLLLVKGFSG